MTPTRFQDLADAFGGDIDRWPAAERPAALALAPSADAILAEATSLDRLLAASPNPAPSLALRQAILAAAPRPHGRRWRAVALGASLAAASVAGILAGAAAAPIAASHIRMQAADTASEASRWLGEPADASEG